MMISAYSGGVLGGLPPIFVDHVVRSKTADLKYFPFCLGRPPLTLSATPSEFVLAVSSPLDKLPFFLFVTELCNLLIKILFFADSLN